ncbi:MAG: hypothetical protein JWM11_5909 [Planctomycetaceae bacterium]|nr:hypothetical protein [Planctomycetaceae bacterium]
MTIDMHFGEIRCQYFPRWDRQREWTVSFGDAKQCRDSTGYCDNAVKSIYINERAIVGMQVAGVRALIIHEICHDVSAAGHNRKWATRMKIAATRAEQIGEIRVAEILLSHVFSSAGNGVLIEYDLDNVIDFVEDLASGNRELEFENAVKRVAKFFGHTVAKVNRDFGDRIENSIARFTKK